MKKDVYGEPEIIKVNNVVAKVFSPIISDEERERRMERIKQASIRLVLSQEKGKDSKNEQQKFRQQIRAESV